MLSFIDQDGIRLSVQERLLKEQAQPCCIGHPFPGPFFWAMNLPGKQGQMSPIRNFILNLWSLEQQERTLVVISPLELGECRRNGI